MKRLMLASAAVALALCAHSSMAQTTSSGAEQAGARQSIRLADGWRFSLAAEASRVEPPQDAASWTTVSVPHTWNRVGYYLPGHPDRVNTAETVNKVQGVGWYRQTFTPTAAFKGKKAWLQFDAASRTAEVWLNGKRLGEHRGGFSRFRFDVTDALKIGAPNLLVVKTDNTRPAAGSTTADVLPLTGDFFIHGGLYRDVSLVATNDVHLDMLDMGGPGVYATTQSIANGSASVSVRSRVSNDGTAEAKLSVVTTLLDAAGAVAAAQTQTIKAPKGKTVEVSQSLTTPNPHLWQGVEDPYLYSLVVEIRNQKGLVLDRLEQPFGIRQMAFDTARGFLLNGKQTRLHGVGLHQDIEGKGWAINRADVEADLLTLREMGANTIRLTHYQHGQAVHDLADKYGFVLWDEIPLVSAWTLGGQRSASPALVDNATQSMREMIRQNFNHASVAAWGLANEVDFGNSLPQFLAGGAGDPPDPMPLLAELQALAKNEDPARSTALANCCEGRLFASNVEVPIVAPAADLAGANRYFGWYYGAPDDLGGHLDSLHAARPNQPLSVSEYGAGGAVTMHTDNPLGGPVDSRGRSQPEEYQSYVHERSWAALSARPYLWATWLWNSFDFASTVRREGDAEDINTKGLVTYDRKVKKDGYFFYKANWTDTPTVHINGRRYIDRAYNVTDVRVYSNAPATELLLNGTSKGVRGDCEQKICVWKDVRLDAGDNRLSAIGRFAQGPIQDDIAWRVAPETARATRIDSGALMAANASTGLFGSDNFFEGGEAKTVNRPADYGKAPERKIIPGTPDSDLAATYREGNFRYAIPLENGRYEVSLTFVEPAAGPGERIFNVIANGSESLPNLDISATAGGPLKAIKRSFSTVVSGGVLNLHFAPVKGTAVVSAVEVESKGR